MSRDAPFDRFVAGDPGALDVTAQQGLRLFIGKARCISCQNGPLLSDEAFHNVAVPASTVDDGRHKDISCPRRLRDLALQSLPLALPLLALTKQMYFVLQEAPDRRD